MCCDAPDVPVDPNIGIAQDKMADLAVRQQDWYETNIAPKALDQLDQSLAISKQQADASSALQGYQLEQGKRYDERYWGTQVPLEDELIAEARKYNTGAERERMAAEAGADYEQAFAQSQGALQRGLRGMGVDLGSAGAVAAFAQARTDNALAKAGAMNKTRQAARELGWTKLGEAAALGRGLPSFGSTSAGLAMGAGTSALTAGTSGLSSVGAAAGINSANTATMGSLWNGVGSLGVGKYNADINAANVKAANDPTQALIGAGTGIGLSYLLRPKK